MPRESFYDKEEMKVEKDPIILLAWAAGATIAQFLPYILRYTKEGILVSNIGWFRDQIDILETQWYMRDSEC